jgi:hypothetical protein
LIWHCECHASNKPTPKNLIVSHVVFYNTRVHPWLSVQAMNLTQWHVTLNTHPLSVDSSRGVSSANEAAFLMATCLLIRIILCVVPTSIFSNDTSQSLVVNICWSCYILFHYSLRFHLQY